jgi:phospholipase C
MTRSLRRLLAFATALLTVMAAVPVFVALQTNAEDNAGALSKINHVVVIYEENHSFDNLYGAWEGVNGRANADPAHTVQVGKGGAPYACLLQDDVNLMSPPLLAICTDTTTGTSFSSGFTNQPFGIEAYTPASARTCPQPGVSFAGGSSLPNPNNLPGGCTRDVVHRFYQEQYQLNNGRQNRYVTGSDAIGMTMGYYNTSALPIYLYLHSPAHPHYAIADDFFQGAFGGSFLNHQWLIAAATPTYPNAPATQNSILDTNGMPTSYKLYSATTPVADKPLTQLCGLPTTDPNVACGDFAVNTIQPPYQPTSSNPLKLPPQTGKTIGDELTSAGVSWAWYSGGWSNADGEVGAPGWTNGATPGVCADQYSFANPAYPFCPNKVFQFHHQPFNYFAAYAPGSTGRTHLRDEQEFIDLANASSNDCKLNSVSFIKPIGLENEHPGYTSETRGSDHLVNLLQAIQNSSCRRDTMVVVTYDEFGGQWDHVTPPGQGGTAGPHDQWGPGTRIPALIISPRLLSNFVVDHTQYDTTSILATIERRYGLAPLGPRDRAVNDLSTVYVAVSPFD